jgi:hypothetical protein
MYSTKCGAVKATSPRRGSTSIFALRAPRRRIFQDRHRDAGAVSMRSVRPIKSTSRQAVSLKVVRMSAKAPTSWTSVDAQPSPRERVELDQQEGLPDAAQAGADDAAVAEAVPDPVDRDPELLEVLIASSQVARAGGPIRRVSIMATVDYLELSGEPDRA